MAVCPKCNTQQPDGLNYCIKCGNPIGAGGAVPVKKGVPAKGLLLGGCGCAVLIAVVIGIIIVLAIVMMSMQKRGPGAVPQPPVVQPQPTAPTPPAVPTPPTVPTAPVTPQPQVDTYPELKQGEIMIRFAKGLTEDGMTIGTTTEFSTNDPQIIQVIRWGPNTVATGAFVVWGWYYNGTTFVWGNGAYAKEGYTGVYDKVDRPANGFPVGEYDVLVLVDSTPVISHKFTVR